jgi:hypothetical protein
MDICPYCKAEMRPLDNHAIKIVADSPSRKDFLIVTCQLTRYYEAKVTDMNDKS